MWQEQRTQLCRNSMHVFTFMKRKCVGDVTCVMFYCGLIQNVNIFKCNTSLPSLCNVAHALYDHVSDSCCFSPNTIINRLYSAKHLFGDETANHCSIHSYLTLSLLAEAIICHYHFNYYRPMS